MHPATLPRPKGAIPESIWRDGKEYFSMTRLAVLRGVSRQACAQWAQRNPELCVTEGKHTWGRHLG